MDRQLYFGSYGHRYSDPCGGYFGFNRQKVAEAIESAIEYEEKELKGYCEGHKGDSGKCDPTCALCEFDSHSDCDECHGDEVEYYPKSECPYCNPDLCFYGVYSEYRPVRSGFVSLAYLKEVWAELQAGNVVPTEAY